MFVEKRIRFFVLGMFDRDKTRSRRRRRRRRVYGTFARIAREIR